MYDDSIKCENKIITKEALQEILVLMGDTIKKYKKISDNEMMKNQMLDTQYQAYTFKDEGSKVSAEVKFYDNTEITFDNYDGVMGAFYNRLEEIKRFNVHFRLSYSTKEANGYHTDMIFEYIHLYISEDKMDISVQLNSKSDKCNEIYELIKTKIFTAPEKYDEVIRKRNKITNTVSFGIGLIPGLVLPLLLLILPETRNILLHYYVVYPLAALFLAYALGGMIGGSKLNKYYTPIVPDKKYAGHDSDYNSVYKDDIESFTNSSEILIGKKVRNLEYRNSILKEYDKYKKRIKIELLVLLAVSVLIVLAGLIIK